MKSVLFVLALGIFFSASIFAQDKTDKGCCSSESSKMSLNKSCDSSEEAYIPSGEGDQTASMQSDDKNKKIEKKSSSLTDKTKKEKSTLNSSDDGCCTSDKKKNVKSKTSKS
ncbi:MAG: hypothetical protein HXY50_03845 [Ignavibacteriaceae bacterium]|nr:hypothetical protein [Ignavibacteriaceae bacterium]